MIDVAFLIGNLNKEHGGAQQLLFDLCCNLPSNEFETTVYYMFGNGTFEPEFERIGATVVDLDASTNYDAKTFAGLIRELDDENYDILHTNSPISGTWGRLAAILAGVPNIVSVEHNVHTAYSRFTRTVNGLTLPLADTIVGVSRSVTDSYLDWERHLIGKSAHCVTIRNGVNVAAIRRTFDRSDEILREYTPFSPSDTIVGTMGRLHRQKGYGYLIRSFPTVKQNVKNAKLLVIGDGPEREKLETMVERTGYERDIHFTGYVPDVYPFLPNFDIAVFPSVWEGFGLTPVESMAAKRPVIGTNIPPFKEVIDDAGILVEPEDEEALASAITSLLQNPERRRELGAKGYNRVVNQFSIERTVEEYAELYRWLLDE